MRDKKDTKWFRRSERPWIGILLGISALYRTYRDWRYYYDQLSNIANIMFTASIFAIAILMYIDKYHIKGPIIPDLVYILLIIPTIISFVLVIIY